eukprot:1063019-Rhodomonas_salina.1
MHGTSGVKTSGIDPMCVRHPPKSNTRDLTSGTNCAEIAVSCDGLRSVCMRRCAQGRRRHAQTYFSASIGATMRTRA